MREDEAAERSDGQRGEMQGQMQGAVEREACEGGLGSRPGGAARSGGQDGTDHGALRDRSEAVREVSLPPHMYAILSLRFLAAKKNLTSIDNK